MKYIYFIILLLVTLTTFADVYTEVDANGSIIFSDTPHSDKARKMSNSEINQSSTIESAPRANHAKAEDIHSTGIEKSGTKKPYTLFAISSPIDQETIQNQPNVAISIKVDPSLQPGDMIQIFLDGHPWGAARDTTFFEFPQPERGIHKLSAALIDSNQIILKQSNSITVYIHQAHIPTSPPPPLSH